MIAWSGGVLLTLSVGLLGVGRSVDAIVLCRAIVKQWADCAVTGRRILVRMVRTNLVHALLLEGRCEEAKSVVKDLVLVGRRSRADEELCAAAEGSITIAGLQEVVWVTLRDSG